MLTAEGGCLIFSAYSSNLELLPGAAAVSEGFKSVLGRNAAAITRL